MPSAPPRAPFVPRQTRGRRPGWRRRRCCTGARVRVWGHVCWHCPALAGAHTSFPARVHTRLCRMLPQAAAPAAAAGAVGRGGHGAASSGGSSWHCSPGCCGCLSSSRSSSSGPWRWWQQPSSQEAARPAQEGPATGRAPAARQRVTLAWRHTTAALTLHVAAGAESDRRRWLQRFSSGGGSGSSVAGAGVTRGRWQRRRQQQQADRDANSSSCRRWRCRQPLRQAQGRWRPSCCGRRRRSCQAAPHGPVQRPDLSSYERSSGSPIGAAVCSVCARRPCGCLWSREPVAPPDYCCSAAGGAGAAAASSSASSSRSPQSTGQRSAAGA
jgi:hypothetical protein